ncbi:rho guanine nucleotide exchange factor 1 isoform X2 [Protopterus annectens]|uniref:rho guanine nucleotide exchange factor 1 isoform X2 n=1 Tax=Protopterus annectens TaxID=7888 RepID=UPI001CF994B3|nr:rho guanine nucleotide exchange factor 1 isoform X2 [Protopterus annectens]
MDLDGSHEARIEFTSVAKQSPPIIIGAEDEDFENDIDPNVDDHCSYFMCLDMLKTHPAHLMAFIHHSILQFDCAPVLAYLHADLFKEYSAKEYKKQFVDFYHTFLEKGAILRVNCPQHISYELDRSRPDFIPEETQKKFLKDIQSIQCPEISKQLEDFRSKRMMGMTPGEAELKELESYRTRDKVLLESKAKQLAETLLAKMEELHQTNVADEERSTAVFNAVVTYMKHLGVKAKVPDKKSKGGFFRKKIPGIPKTREEPVRSKNRIFFNPWNAANQTSYKEGARGDSEGDRSVDRKTSQVSKIVDRSDGSGVRVRASVSGAEGKEPSATPVTTISFPAGDHSELDTAPLGVRQGPEGQCATDVSEPPSKISGDQPAQEHLPDEPGDSDRLTSKLGRSESLRVYERKRSQRGSSKGKQPRSRSDVDLDAAVKASNLQQQQQVQQGSLTLDPGGSDGGEPPQPFLPSQSGELEPPVSEDNDPPNWRDLVGPETLSRLTKSEIKRQEVINELFMTEHAHVRMLKVLNDVFYQPMLDRALFTSEELKGIFPGLDDLIDLHVTFCDNLKKLRHEDDCVVKEIGKVLLDRFDSSEGMWFQKISSRFCSHQTYALEQIKQKQKKDPHFNAFIQDAERKRQCRRLQLKDIIPIEMQRLTKYPLLLHNIGKCTEQEEEKQRVLQAADCCRKILNHVNEKVHQMENLLYLRDVQRRLDTSGLKQVDPPLEYRTIDLTHYDLIHAGPLLWRVGKEKTVDVTVLLLSSMLVLLQKQDDKLLLKCQSRNSNALDKEMKEMSPIIKLNSTVLLRPVATDKNAFYVITSDYGVHMYELVAQTEAEQSQWKEHISKVANSIKVANTRTSVTTPLPTSPLYGKFSNPLSSGSRMQYTAVPNDNKDDETLDHELGSDVKSSAVDAGRRLIQYLLDHNVNLFGHDQLSQTQIASSALEEVSVLKRMLVRNIRLSLDDCSKFFNSGFDGHSLNVPEIGIQFTADGIDKERNSEGTDKSDTEQKEEVDDELGEGIHKLESRTEDGVEKLDEEDSNTEGGYLKLPNHQSQDLSTSQESITESHTRSDDIDSESMSAPIILSQEQSQEVQKKIWLLENKIKELKVVEDEYFHLREALVRFTSS